MDSMTGIKIAALIAGVTGMGASVVPGLPETSTLDALGRWPLTVILGAVCVTCVYFMYKQSKDNADRNVVSSTENGKMFLAMIEGERLATEKRITSNALVTKELAENNAKMVRELAESHAKEIRTLLDELSKQTKPN
jgi:hypothetical protein